MPADHAIGLGRRRLPHALVSPVHADHDPVVGAVEGALELGELGPAGEGAGQAHGVHRGLGARVREAQALHRGHPPHERLGQPDLVLGGARERQARLGHRLHGLHHVGRGVAEDQARVVAVEVHALDAVGVPDVGALPALEVERIRIEERRRAAVAARHDRHRLLVERARAARLRRVLGQLLVKAHADSSFVAAAPHLMRRARQPAGRRRRWPAPSATPPQAMRLGDVDGAEAHALPRLHLPDAPDVERAHRGDLRVAAGRLPVDQQHDRLAVAGHLDRAERDAVRDDVVAARVRDAGPRQARAHAVGLRQHLVGPAEERRDALGGEAVGLRARAPRGSPARPRSPGSRRRASRRARRHRRREQPQHVVALAARAPRGRRGGRAGRSRASRAPAARRGRPRTRRRRARPRARGADAHGVARRQRAASSTRGAAAPLTVTGASAPVTAIAHAALDREARAHQRALEAGGAVGVADEPVGDHERAHVHRPRGRDAVAELAGAPEVLHGRLRAGIDDADHAIDRRVGARGHAGGDGVVLRAIDRPHAHAVARRAAASAPPPPDRRAAPACGRAASSRRGSRPSRCSTGCRRARRCPAAPSRAASPAAGAGCARACRPCTADPA